MDYILGPLLSYLLLYKYLALFAIAFFASLIIPLPLGVMMLAVGAFSSQGYFNFWLSLILTVVASTLGDIADYGIARRYGDQVTRILRLNRVRFFTSLKEELQTNAATTVFITRFAGSLSTVTSFLAGLTGVSFATFLLYDVLGNIIEPFVELSTGYLAGSYWNNFSGLFSISAGIIAISVMLWVLSRVYRRITGKYATE